MMERSHLEKQKEKSTNWKHGATALLMTRSVSNHFHSVFMTQRMTQAAVAPFVTLDADPMMSGRLCFS